MSSINIYSKYNKWYDSIICNARSRKNNPDLYLETHHIIPKCLHGTNDKTNLVKLTAREHFIVHKILCKIYPENEKLKWAVWRFITRHNTQNAIIISARDYEKARINFIKDHPMKNDLIKDKVRDKQTDLYGTYAFNTLENRKKIKQIWKEKYGTDNFSEVGKKAFKAKTGLDNIRQKQVTCPHCGKSGQYVAFKRWHFDNCKNL